MLPPDEQEATPWYRQFWPWFILALPCSVIVASGFTVWLAVREAPALVVDDYSKIGLATYRKMARDRQAAELGLNARVYLIQDPDRVEIELTAADSMATPGSLTLSLLHPTLASGDKVLELRSKGRRFVSLLEELPAQRMYLQIEPPDRSWRLTGEWIPGVKQIDLAPPE